MIDTLENSVRLPARQQVVGVAISKTSYREVVDVCGQWIAKRAANTTIAPAMYICVTSVHGVMTAREEPEVRRILNDADIATPDGMPLVWALRSFGAQNQQRVYGPTLMLHLCEEAERRGQSIFLYGGRTETLPVLQEKLKAKFPGLKLAGAYSPPFRPLTDEEERDVQEQIRNANPDIIFVGISTPKQERWMAAHRQCFAAPVMVGVGAAFDFHAGRVKQAPGWMQRGGLEWLFRLLSEPRRLWKRYLLVTPRFLPYWALQKAGVLRYELPAK